MGAAIRRSLKSAREDVDRFDRRVRSQGNDPQEETLTDILLAACGDSVRYARFNRPQEGRVGADWLWWFVDEASGECFGMLVQAKRLKLERKRWTVNLPYRNGEQLAALMTTAEHLGVPACYVVYCGSESFRNGFGCGHGAPGCRECERKGVSILAGPVARRIIGIEEGYLQLADNGSRPWNPEDPAAWVMAASEPLENAADHRRQPAFNPVPIELAELLLKPTSTPRSICSAIFQQLAHDAGLQFRAQTEQQRSIVGGLHSSGSRVVSAVSLSGLSPVYEHSLQGLRTGLPEPVLAALDGNPDALPGVDGVAVFTEPVQPGAIPTAHV